MRAFYLYAYFLCFMFLFYFQVLRTLQKATARAFNSLDFSAMKSIQIQNMSMWDKYDDNYKFLPKMANGSNVSIKQIKYLANKSNVSIKRLILLLRNK